MRPGELLRARPDVRRVHGHAIGKREERGPTLFPQRVIVLADAVVLGAVAEDDVQRGGSRREEALFLLRVA